MDWKSIGDAIWDLMGFRGVGLKDERELERLHNWVLAWMLSGNVVRDGRRVYYRDGGDDVSGGDWYPSVMLGGGGDGKGGGDTAAQMRELDWMMLGHGKGVVMMTKVKMGDLTLEERETAIVGNAGDRGVWRIYSDDPVMIGRLEKLGMKGVEREDGIGKEFLVTANQVSFRRERIMTEEERRIRGDRARAAFGHGQPKSTAQPVREVEKCEYCDGTGWEDGLVEGEDRVVCSVCGGTGTKDD